MTEQARPFKGIQNRVETLGAPPVEAPSRPAIEPAIRPYEEEPEAPQRTLLGRAFEYGWMNREKLIWLAIIGLAVASRLWDLAPRAFHHDESIHGVFSYEMYTGKNIYRYDPTWHGPVLYYMVTLSYFLLGGASEFSARFAPAMFGIGLVALAYLLRPLIGKVGAIIFAILLLISPTILYYSRSLRHDIFATFGMMLFVIGLFRFAMARGNKRLEIRWMALSGLGFFVLFGSHEMSFLNLAIVLSWLGIVFLFEIVVLPAWVGRSKIEDRRSKIEGRRSKVEGRRSKVESRRLRDADDDELDDLTEEDNLQSAIVNLQSEAVQPTLAGFEEVEVVPAATVETEEEAVEERWERIGTGRDQILGRFWPVFGVLFGLLAVTVLVGSVHLFSDRTSDGSLQKLFGVNSYFILIPLYLAIGAGAAYPLAKLVNYGYNRLGAQANLMARVTAGVAFVGLALVSVVYFLRGVSPANYMLAVNLQFSGNSSPALDDAVAKGFGGYSQISYVGLSWPVILPLLVFSVVVALLAGMLAGWLLERGWLVYTEKGFTALLISALFVLLIASLISLRFILVTDKANLPKVVLPLVGTLDKWLAYVLGGAVLALVIGFVAGWFVSLAEKIDDRRMAGSTVTRAILRFARNPWSVVAWLLGFGILYVLIFSNFFFSPERLADGFYRGIEYWGEQHGLRRLDQPWFYYPMLMLLYETFAVLFAFVALVYFPVSWWRRTKGRTRFVFTPRGVFIGLSFWWSALALVMYTIAGEKIPWLNMQIALPFSLAAAAFLNDYLTRLNWKRLLAWKEGLLFGGMFLVMFALTLALIGLVINFPKTAIYNPGLGRNATNNDLIIAGVQVLVVGAIWLGLFIFAVWRWWTKRLSGPTARAAILLLAGGLLFAYCFKSTIALNYLHPDTPVEPMIYTQTAPEVVTFVQRVDRMSQDLRYLFKPPVTQPQAGQPAPVYPDPTQTKSLPMYISSEVAWPLHWYFRDYTDVNWGTLSSDPNNPAVLDKLTDSRGTNYAMVLVSSGENTSKLQDQLSGQYTAHYYRFRWHFPEDDSGYGGLGYDPPDDPRDQRIAVKDIINTRWDLMWRALTEQPYAGRLWRYIVFRELWQPLQSFDMVAYVRNDLDPEFSLSNNTSITAGVNVEDTLPAFDLTASSTAGNRNGQYRTPRNVAIAPNGDILVLDSLNGRVQRFDKNGKYLSKFGQIGNGDGQFTLAQYQSGPGGITTDEDGNIYVTDTWGYRIEKFDKDGKFLLKWGTAQDTKGDLTANKQNPTGFYGPRSIAYDQQAGELYITDTGNRRVVVYDKQGQFKRQFGSLGSGPGQFNEPESLALGPDGKVYVADLRNKRIEVLDKQGNYLSEIAVPSWKEGVLNEPYLAFSPQGDLFASDPANGAILRIDKDGKPVTTYSSSGGLAVINPVGLTFDKDGNLYIADAQRNAIVKFKP